MLQALRTLAKRLDSLQAKRNARIRGRFRFMLPFFNLVLKMRTRNPVSFDDKVEYKMARDRRPFLTVFADKLEAKKYVEQVLGPGYVPEVLAVAECASDLPWNQLPRQFAAKVNHGSGGIVVFFDRADPGEELPEPTIENAWKKVLVRPTRADPVEVTEYLNLHLGLNYYPLFGEWCYRDVKPKAFIEEFLPLPAATPSVDYRLHVFGGICQLIIRSAGISSGEPTRDFFRPDWTHLDARLSRYPNAHPQPPEPDYLEEMIAVASALGRQSDFLRVDVMVTNDRVLIGELTNYPNGGRAYVSPEAFGRWMGDLWELPYDYGALPHGTYPLPARPI